MSARTNQRGGTASRGRGSSATGRPQVPPGASAAWAFPPALPPSIAKEITGDVKGVTVEYTKYGVQVFVVKNDNSRVPLEEHQSAEKAEKAARILREDVARFRERIAERQIGITLPAVERREQLDQFLAGLDAAQRRLLTMTNRDFRAQQGANDEQA